MIALSINLKARYIKMNIKKWQNTGFLFMICLFYGRKREFLDECTKPYLLFFKISQKIPTITCVFYIVHYFLSTQSIKIYHPFLQLIACFVSNVTDAFLNCCNVFFKEKFQRTVQNRDPFLFQM